MHVKFRRPPESHRCNEHCSCPIHETPLLYAPSTDDHACQDVECQYGHGMRRAAQQR